MNVFLIRRFAVWWIPLVVVTLAAPQIWGVTGQLLGMGFMIVWTIVLLLAEKRISRFGRWMNQKWYN